MTLLRAQQRRERRRDRLRVRLDRDLARVGQRREQPLERGELGEGRRPAAEEDASRAAARAGPVELELGEQRLDVGAVLALPADRGDEVAVAAAVRAERQVEVEVRARSCRRGVPPRPRHELALAVRADAPSSSVVQAAQKRALVGADEGDLARGASGAAAALALAAQLECH